MTSSDKLTIKMENKSKINLIIIIALFILPIVSVSIKPLMTPSVNYDKSVWASLYTWWGVPGQPAGKYGYDEWQKNASDPSDIGFNSDLSTMTSIQDVSTDFLYNISGKAIEIGQSLVYYINYSRVAYSRMYIELNLSVGNLANADVEIQIYSKVYNKETEAYDYYICNTTILEDDIPGEPSYIANAVCFTMLNKTLIDYYPGRIATINVTAKQTGNFSLGINYMEGSTWKHYNEDYHTYADEEGLYHNDPPVHLATAQRAYYNSSKWPEIPSYGDYNHSKWNELPAEINNDIFYGVYDSLNETVIKAQLLLMEKGGIDVCQLMHPWDVSVGELILNIAEEINSNLTFSYYTGRGINQVAKIMETIAKNERFYKIDGKAVITWGYTGGLDEPYQLMYQKAMELKRAYDIFFVGDLYSSRFITKEEMLYVYDCLYYYDTSAFLRHGYTLPGIENYQADGTLYPFNNWGNLDQIFGSIASLAHGHGKAFCAIVIPGTDNTAVHDFKGTELYDGRTGTINSRSNGLTFNYTWQAAIDAGSDFVDIVSWNELHEGTEIEPTFENGTYYVEMNKYWSNEFKNS